MLQADTKKNPLIFVVHIPKTAGRSLEYNIKANFKKKQIFITGGDEESINELINYSPSQKSKLKIITGHFYYGLHEHFQQPYKYITILRKPIDRVFSLYHYMKNTDHHYLNNEMNKYSIEEVLENQISTEFNNGQTRQISGINNNIFELNNREMLIKAKKNLETNFNVIGLTERFDDTLVLLKYEFGWNVCSIYQNVNKKKGKKSELSDKAILLINKYNGLDIELYAYAEKIFNKQLKAINSPMDIEIKKLKSITNINRLKWLSKEILKKALKR